MQITYNILFTFSIFLVNGLSFSLLYSSAQFFNIGHAAIIASGAYFTYVFSSAFGLHIVVAGGLSIMSASILGILLEVIAFKPLGYDRTSSLKMLLASVGIYAILHNIFALIWGTNTLLIRPGQVEENISFIGVHTSVSQLIIMLAGVVCFAVAVLALKKTRLGKIIRAIQGNSNLCIVYGIEIERIRLAVYAISSAIGAFSGILYTYSKDITYMFEFNFFMYGAIMTIISGVGNYTGILRSALLLACIQHLTAYAIGSKWSNAVIYGLLLCFLIWKRQGFEGLRLKKVEV